MTRRSSIAALFCLLALAFSLGGCSSSANQSREPAATEAELEVIAGLKEAMVTGTLLAVDRLGRPDGYLGDPAVRIALPDDVQKIIDALRGAKLGYLVDDLEVAINRAAENAATEAYPILAPAAQDMYVLNANKLLAGKDTAITRYFRQRTANQVDAAYQPVIARYLEAEPGYQQWRREVAERKRSFYFLNEVDTEPIAYLTNAALDGLFLIIGETERDIRTKPEKRTTPLLQTVFKATP